MPDYKLSDAEMYIMRCFWAAGPMKTDELAAQVRERGWKPTTLLTFLSRLVAKGMLAAKKQGKSNLYRPLVSQQVYTQAESRVFLDQLYGGSARNFLAAMVEGRAISTQELAEMRQWLEEEEGEADD